MMEKFRWFILFYSEKLKNHAIKMAFSERQWHRENIKIKIKYNGEINKTVERWQYSNRAKVFYCMGAEN